MLHADPPEGYLRIDFDLGRPTTFNGHVGTLYARRGAKGTRDEFVLGFRVHQHMANPAGGLHGGMMMTVADLVGTMGGGTLVGLRGEPRIVMLDGHTIDLPPAGHMLVVRNADRPGMIAYVSGVLAEAGVNIDDMHLGRSERGAAALQVIATDRLVPPEVQDLIRAGDGIVSVHAVG